MSNRKALLGKKLGMSQVWDENGFFVPVTLVDVSTNVVTAVKTEESDGYKAVQLGYGAIDPTKVTKPLAGHFAKAGVTPRRHLVEVRTDDQIVDSGALMATLVATDHVAMALDHHKVYGSGNVVFIPIDEEGMDLCCGPIWKKSKETDVLLSFLDFLVKETKGFTKDDFLSREGAEDLPPL